MFGITVTVSPEAEMEILRAQTEWSRLGCELEVVHSIQASRKPRSINSKIEEQTRHGRASMQKRRV
jgi:hypothetical protein